MASRNGACQPAPRLARIDENTLREERMRHLAVAALAALAVSSATHAAELRISRQPGLIFMPLTILEHDKLIEKRAAATGLGDLKVEWLAIGTGGASTDALLSGN